MCKLINFNLKYKTFAILNIPQCERWMAGSFELRGMHFEIVRKFRYEKIDIHRGSCLLTSILILLNEYFFFQSPSHSVCFVCFKLLQTWIDLAHLKWQSSTDVNKSHGHLWPFKWKQVTQHIWTSVHLVVFNSLDSFFFQLFFWYFHFVFCYLQLMVFIRF